MKQSILNEINSLFETGEIETIKFSKTGKVSVKYVKEPYIIQHAKSANIIEEIKEYAEIYKSLEKVVKKPNLVIAVAEIEKINVIAEEVKFMPIAKSENKSRFERFYDAVGKFLGGGKSFAPNELKTFA